MCRSGGIGRHAGLRNQCLRACRFESCLRYVRSMRLAPERADRGRSAFTPVSVAERLIAPGCNPGDLQWSTGVRIPPDTDPAGTVLMFRTVKQMVGDCSGLENRRASGPCEFDPHTVRRDEWQSGLLHRLAKSAGPAPRRFESCLIRSRIPWPESGILLTSGSCMVVLSIG